MKLAWDVDDVLYEWYDLAHDVLELAGLTGEFVNGRRPQTWYPWEEYGCITKEEWIAGLEAATLSGWLYLQDPVDDALKAMTLLTEAGWEHHIITARGSFDHGEAIKEHTRFWVAKHFPGVRSVSFTHDKERIAKTLGVTHAVDDRVVHAEGYESVGITAYLMDRPWNQEYETDRRVHSVSELAERLLEGGQ